MKKAFIYARVSTGEQSKGYSLEAQFDEIKKFCSEKSISIIDSYQDAMSGTKLIERTGLMSLLDRLEKEKPNFVIATESDRISRNTFQFGWIDTHLSMKGVKLLLVNEREVDGPFEKAFQKIRAVFSEFETDLRQWRIDRGREKAKLDKRFMNRPPFGYKMDGKRIIQDKEKIEFVKGIFSGYCNNTPIKRLARIYSKSPSAIRYILSNPFYIMENLYGKHEPCIANSLFLEANDKLQKSRSFSTWK